MSENEWAELMPHQIKVTSNLGFDDYGKELPNTGFSRVYWCLVDDSTTTVRNAGGEEVTVALTAFVWPVPVGSPDGLPVDIESTDKVEILSPRAQTRTLTSVERHYYSERGVGFLHNLVLRFS